MADAPLRVSVAIPVYNEESLVDELVRRTLAVLDGIPGGPHELTIVDDGSSDATHARLADAASRDPRLRVTRLSRNFGHQIALSAALDSATGDAVVMMDGDLQDAPETIPALLAKSQEGFAVVYAIRASRKESWLLRTCYRAFYRLLGRLSDITLPLDAGDFCLITRPVADAIRSAPERHRYLRGLRAWVGFPQVGILVDRGCRASGKSKYTWFRLFGLAFDGLCSFSTAPLRLATLLGMVTIAGAFLLGVLWIVAKIAGLSPQGFTALATSISFLGGVQLLSIGIIGEYVGRIYDQVKQRPLYVVASVVQRNDHE